jgi:dethiobiotin synthetase
MNGVFITGSNTDVGKTTVGVEVIRHLSKTRKVKARKPVETNCQLINETYAPKDAIALNEVCSEPELISIVCPYCFELEASPEEASSHDGTTLSIDALVSACNADTEDSFVVVEGAGGLYSPIADASLNSDLAKRLQVPIVIVIRDELGAISQALLTIEAAKKNKLSVSCVVLNEIQANDLCNKEALAAYTKIPVVSFSTKNLGLFYTEIEGLI